MAEYKKSEYYNAEAFQVLFNLIVALNAYSIGVGQGPLMVTSLLRPDDLDSYHSKLQAFDLRDRDKPEWWRRGVILIIMGFKTRYPELQYEIEKDHIHIECDTGDINA